MILGNATPDEKSCPTARAVTKVHIGIAAVDRDEHVEERERAQLRAIETRVLDDLIFGILAVRRRRGLESQPGPKLILGHEAGGRLPPKVQPKLAGLRNRSACHVVPKDDRVRRHGSTGQRHSGRR